MSELRVKIEHTGTDGFRLAVDTTVPLSGVTALYGANGSGKTSVLDCVAGLRPDLGNATVTCADRVWQEGQRRLPVWDRALGYVFQDARLFPHLSVAGNLAYAERRAAPGHFSRAQVVSWLALEDLLDRRPETLSAGQRQRVAIGRALLRNPSLLLLDEPLANLDRTAAAEVLDHLRRLSRETGVPMLYVSHQIEEICAIADRLLLMEQGEVVAEGPLLELAGRLDTRLAENEAAAAILDVETVARDPLYQLMELRVGDQSLWVSADDSESSRRRLRVPARDVSVCRERPRHSSILNILETELDGLRDLTPAHCLLRLRLGGQFLLARITCRSRDELNLKPGDRLYAQIKSTALLGDGGLP